MAGKVVIGDDAVNVVLSLTRGSDRRFTVRWKDSFGIIVPIASVSGKILDDDGDVLLADISSVTTITPAGEAAVAILAAATSAMGKCEHGSWDITAVSTTGETKTLVTGSVVCKDPTG